MTTELALNFEEDYRVIYMDEDFFLQSFQDAYVGTVSVFSAIDFVDILVNMTHVIAYYYFISCSEHHPLQQNKSEKEKEITLEKLTFGDYNTTNDVMEYVEENFIELFARDLHIFLRTTGFYYFDYDYSNPEGVRVYNEPFHSAW